MSLTPRHWMALGGAPVGGVAPTRLEVYPVGASLSSDQKGMVSQTYGKFCDQVRTSSFPNGYHKREMMYPDGTAVVMDSMQGRHRVWVEVKSGGGGQKKGEGRWFLYYAIRNWDDRYAFVRVEITNIRRMKSPADLPREESRIPVTGPGIRANLFANTIMDVVGNPAGKLSEETVLFAGGDAPSGISLAYQNTLRGGIPEFLPFTPVFNQSGLLETVPPKHIIKPGGLNAAPFGVTTRGPTLYYGSAVVEGAGAITFSNTYTYADVGAMEPFTLSVGGGTIQLRPGHKAVWGDIARLNPLGDLSFEFLARATEVTTGQGGTNMGTVRTSRTERLSGPPVPLPFLTLSPDGKHWIDNWGLGGSVIRQTSNNAVVTSITRPTITGFNDYLARIGWTHVSVVAVDRCYPCVYLSGLEIVIYECFMQEAGSPPKAYVYACDLDGGVVAQLSYQNENLRAFHNGDLTPSATNIAVGTGWPLPANWSWPANYPPNRLRFSSFVKYIES